MRINIFYSWQSDSPQNVNRSFIEDAAQYAIDQIVFDSKLMIEAALDRDTQNLPGSPAIMESILQKIDRCGIFLCDITLINPGNDARPTPNPNVLIELGYAIAKVGWDRIICVMNEEFGGPSRLPFDLRHRRWPIRYRLAASSPHLRRDEEKRRLSQNIEYAIRTVLSSGLLTSSVNPKDRRVALALARALMTFRAVLDAFLLAHQSENNSSIFSEDYPDQPGTQFPAPELVETIMQILSTADLNSPSNVQIGDTRLSWTEALRRALIGLSRECDVILDRYADRDEQLIAVVENIQIRSSYLASMIHASITQPSLKGLYDAGIPDIHADWFRYFLLTVLKAYRVIRNFSEVRV
jgi:hypothetical protein